MSKPKAIDVSPEAVGAAVEALGCSRSVNSYFSDATLHKFGDMIAALSAALTEAISARDAALSELAKVKERNRDLLLALEPYIVKAPTTAMSINPSPPKDPAHD